MARTNRRRTLIGLVSIVFGASGAVASGAFNFGSEGSLGDDWVQVEGTNQAVEFNTAQLTDEAAVSEGEEGDDDGGDGGSEDSGGSGESTDGTTDGGGADSGGSDESTDETIDGNETTDEEQTEAEPQENTDDGTDTGGGGDQTPSTRVQVVTDPNNQGNALNTPGAAQWNGNLVSSDILLGTDQGFFRGINVKNANKNAVNTLGTLDEGYPGDLIAFVIANVGPENGGAGQAVDVSTQLFTDGSPLETEQLRFPYRVVDSSGTTTTKGENLLAESAVRLPDSHVIEIVIIVDTRTGTEKIERVDSIRFIAEGVN